MNLREYIRFSSSIVLYIFTLFDIVSNSARHTTPREHIFKPTTSNLTEWVQKYHLQHLTSEYVFKCPSTYDYRILCDHDWSGIHRELLNCRHANSKYFRKIRTISFSVIGVETLLIACGLIYVCNLRFRLKRTYETITMRLSSIENNREVT